MSTATARVKRRFSLREIYEAMLYGVPKVKATWWKKVFNKHKGIHVIEGACAIGRVAMNLGLEDYRGLTDALYGIKIEYADKQSKKRTESLAQYIMTQNDSTSKSIEDIAEEVKNLVNLDQVIEVK